MLYRFSMPNLRSTERPAIYADEIFVRSSSDNPKTKHNMGKTRKSALRLDPSSELCERGDSRYIHDSLLFFRSPILFRMNIIVRWRDFISLLKVINASLLLVHGVVANRSLREKASILSRLREERPHKQRYRPSYVQTHRLYDHRNNRLQRPESCAAAPDYSRRSMARLGHMHSFELPSNPGRGVRVWGDMVRRIAKNESLIAIRNDVVTVIG
jgi:hypothetical protein